MQHTRGGRRHGELITRHVRSPRVDLIVLRKDARAPDVMFVVIGAVGFDQIGLVVMCSFVEITVRFDET